MPAPVRVLLVDDDAFTRFALAAAFLQAGFDVLEAGSGREALELLPRQPRLIVLDVQLPDIDGFELCRRIRATPGTTSIAILHLSALHTASADRARGLDGGAEAFLVKPVDSGELLATARALLRLHAAQDAVQHAAQQWRTTFDALSDAICLLDPAGAILRCNRAMAGLLGRPFAELLGKSFPGTLREALQLSELPEFLEQGCPEQREVRELCLGERWFLATHDPVRDGSRPSACVTILSDITQRKQLEEQLRQKQKMEAIGRLAGGVAHDFNNLLTAILGNASLLQQQLVGDPAHEQLRTVERAAWRAAELTRQLLGFSQQTLLWLEPCCPNDSVREVVTLLARSLDRRVRVETRLHAGLGRVQADPAQLVRVLTNLCLNARDAMPEGGRLVIETASCLVDAASASRHPDARPGPAARLSVIDTGMGISAELLPRIFDPFFSTKPAGTGLGLAMVFGIVRQHEGWIECHSEMGRGTRFDVYLPLLAEPAAASAEPAPAAARTGGETILVADDNEMLCKLAATLLRQHGYEVLMAGDGREAVELFRGRPGAIALVLLDVMMPVLSGVEAAHELRRLDPEVRIVLASGFADLEPGEVERTPVQGFIAKPYRERDLIAAVQAALGAPVGNGLCAVP